MKKMINSRLEYVKSLSGDKDLRSAVQAIPKYEFHVHLGGSVRRETAIEMALKNGVSLPADKQDFLNTSTPMNYFKGEESWELFHNAYKWNWSCVKSCDDLQRIVFEFLEDSHLQGVVHSEFTVSGSYLMNTFPFDEWVDAVDRGIQEGQNRYGIKSAAILDISRRFGPENALKNVHQIIENNSKALCAIGMGGDEVKYPQHLFSEAFALAKKNGIFSTVHVSEFRSGEATITAINDLKPDRLGHALTTVKSDEAYNLVKETNTPIECCPLCNYVFGMGGLTSFSEHPIRKYYDEGVSVTINTDDPVVFGFDLIDNYILLMKELDFTLEDFEKINRDAANHSFIVYT